MVKYGTTINVMVEALIFQWESDEGDFGTNVSCFNFFKWTDVDCGGVTGITTRVLAMLVCLTVVESVSLSSSKCWEKKDQL